MPGIVYLIGAGPGAPDLISLRGQRILRQADVILCDNLLPRSFLDQLGISTSGKTVLWRGAGYNAMSQNEIKRILCEEAEKGRIVARLKNGDPSVFGRVSEEIAALQERGIPWVIVPGISSYTAAPASAGLMLTDRASSRSFAVTSAVCGGGAPNTHYPVADSLVLLMGVKSLEPVAASLLDSGWPPNTPVAIIERATLSFERHVSAPLSHIAEVARNASIKPPSILLMGKAALAENVAWRARVLFTGLEPAGFLGLGHLLHWPAQAVFTAPELQAQYAPVLDDIKGRLFETVIFCSVPGTALFFQTLESKGLDARLFSEIRLIAAGQGTAHKLNEYGIRADHTFYDDAAREIPAALDRVQLGRILVVKAGRKQTTLEASLEVTGSPVKSVVTCELKPHPRLGEPLPEHDSIYFVSPAGVGAYWNAYGNEAFQKEVHCIGPATQATLNALGVQAAIINPYRQHLDSI